MPVVPIYLNIDDKTYQGIKAGTLELYGLAKNANTKRVAKHIPTVADATKESASKVIDFVRAHQKGAFIISACPPVPINAPIRQSFFASRSKAAPVAAPVRIWVT